MGRKSKILQHIDKNGFGIEIGPGHNPIAPKKSGYKVHIIDHMNREQLVAKYREHNVNTEAIEQVDYVWQGESYSELTGKAKYYDWIIASHVIEHTPDMIGFLNDCDDILKDDGVISLVVPDKRYCFDHYRPITGISKILDSHYQKSDIHSPGIVAEYFLNVVSNSGALAWDQHADGQYEFVHSIQDAIRGIKSVVDDHSYLDVHAWCFVPHSFRLIIHDLYCLGLISLREVDFHPTTGNEFYITLGRLGNGIEKPRIDVLEIIESEIGDGVDGKRPPFLRTSKVKNIIKRMMGRVRV